MSGSLPALLAQVAVLLMQRRLVFHVRFEQVSNCTYVGNKHKQSPPLHFTVQHVTPALLILMKVREIQIFKGRLKFDRA